MNKMLIYCVTILSIVVIPIKAQSYSSNQVSLFANYISKWTSMNQPKYRFLAEELCNGSKKTIICDESSHILTKKNNPNAPLQKSYELETYFNNIEKQVKKGKINITYTNISRVEKNEIIFNSNISDKDLKLTEFFCCKINITGDIQHTSNELFYVYKNKIVKIDTYEKKQGKVIVDFDDFINDYETVGFSYNYGKYFPIGGSFNYSFEEIPFMLSVDFGINLDGDKYIIDKVDMKDILNYTRSKKVVDTKFFLSLTPQVYFKYFAIGCGVGFLYMDGTKETANSVYTSSSTTSGNVSVTISGSSSQSIADNYIMLKPMIRPVAKGFIPISDEFWISLSVGYDLIFGYKEKNGLNFGLGFQWEL